MACVAQLTFWERQIILSHNENKFYPREITYATAYDTFKIQDSLKLKVYQVQIEMYRFIVAVIG